MFALHTVLADSIVMSGSLFGYKFVITLSQLVYWIIAALIGVLAEIIVGWRLPFGVIGAICAALIGVWLMTNIIVLAIPGEPTLYGVPLFKAFFGAILFVSIWHLFTYRSWARPRRA